MPQPGRWTVDAGSAGARLDRALAAHLALPRNQVEGWIADGRVALDGRAAAKGGAKLAPGMRVEWTPPPPPEESLRPEPGELRVVFEDAAIVVVDKPPGLVVHPGAGRRAGTLVHRLLARYPELAGVGGPGRPGIVHRLDRGTSGLVVVARTAAAYAALVRAFAERTVEKRYLALVAGRPRRDTGEIDAPIGRHARERMRMAVAARGKPARTSFRVVAAARGVALLEVAIATGRTHQIRVHLAHAGHPVLGDPVYGRRAPAAGAAAERPALHAWRLALPHPATGATVRFEAPVPADLAEVWRRSTGRDWPGAALGAAEPGRASR